MTLELEHIKHELRLLSSEFELVCLAAPVAFYPFGSVAGDTVGIAVQDENSTLVDLWRPFVFFGRTYNKTYVRIQFCFANANGE